jgi:hypothetical protein
LFAPLVKTMKLTASPAAKARFERLGAAHKPAAEPLDPAATAAARNAQREQNKRIREILAARYPVFGSASRSRSVFGTSCGPPQATHHRA